MTRFSLSATVYFLKKQDLKQLNMSYKLLTLNGSIYNFRLPRKSLKNLLIKAQYDCVFNKRLEPVSVLMKEEDCNACVAFCKLLCSPEEGIYFIY